MFTLTYLSTAASPFDESELRELLEVSRRNNTAAGLSGMLLYVEGHFIQTLEGDEQAVDSAFDRISADPRHRDVLVVLREQSDGRVFEDWSMGFEELTRAQAEAVPGFTEFLDARTTEERDVTHLGDAGIFHRIFRDRMRADRGHSQL